MQKIEALKATKACLRKDCGLSKPKLVKSENEKLKKIREDLNKSRHKFSKSKIKEIRKNLYETENKKNLSTQKKKRLKKVFLGLKSIMIMMMLST